MRHVTGVKPAGEWMAGDAATVTLAFDDRHRRRIKLTDDAGAEFLLDLAEAVRLEDGDGLVLDTGGIIAVCAAEEDVLDITCDNASEIARVAWHIGNRHTPVQVLPEGTLRIAYDHVLEAMIIGLGAAFERRQAPFSPEPGAYAEGGHGH
ncbi:MAG: Urease accessory protein UreE [Rhodospirillaceae bacterium]|jgi:urease accessory protein|nr:Urease accessory protein UreE [Rhodospirillaceae bacterium]|tara:strand:+ start:439 stop:888 length:450 start_codon:yes stop_codon:yes gene_type:complete